LRATRRRWNPNLQKMRIQEGTSTKRVYVCTSCLKAFKVQKASPF
jgi:large subunit ribosomal protein L28